MKIKIKSRFVRTAAFIMTLAVLSLSGYSEKLVILHTNDTHSAIDPDAEGKGGILQRKAIFDSIRNVEPNVITVDAGDMVQGTLYFNYFKGDVEYPLFNMMGYDIRILGNHEFDNGMDALAKQYAVVEGNPLSANYDFSGTVLENIFKPYAIIEKAGKKIGFIGINIDPSSIIAQKNIDVNYLEVIPEANRWAEYLKKEMGCDLVVAVTHIGYDKLNDKTNDPELVAASKDIDLVIGGHSHTLIDPKHPEINPSLFDNSEGRPVRITQTGKGGKYVGKITIDLDNLEGFDGTKAEYELIEVTDRFPSSVLDRQMEAFITPYRERVDSVYNNQIGVSKHNLEKERLGGLANMTADFGFNYGKHIADSLRTINSEFPEINLSIMNVGGIRHPMPQGKITEGQILATYPFSNSFVLVKVKGKDIIEALKVSARKGGEAVSSNIRVKYDKSKDAATVVINGEEMDPEKEYVLGTIDYVAEGNDDLVSLANHEKLWMDDRMVSEPILMWIKHETAQGREIAPELDARFIFE